MGVSLMQFPQPPRYAACWSGWRDFDFVVPDMPEVYARAAR